MVIIASLLMKLQILLGYDATIFVVLVYGGESLGADDLLSTSVICDAINY